MEGQVDVHVGTLSKAVGAQGGFVACSHAVRDVLLTRGRSFVYSTGLALPVVAAAQASLDTAAKVSCFHSTHQVEMACLPSAWDWSLPSGRRVELVCLF